MSEHATLAREYLRISLDRTGRSASPDEQHAENAEAAAERSWILGEPYREAGDRSASRFATKAREEYARLTADLEHGRFRADYLVLWEGSRGSREIEEWVRLVKLCERAGVQFYITSEDRVLDPRNDHDWSTLISMGQQSEAESRKISKRVKRATRASAKDGRPHGQVPYGYRRVYGPHPKVAGKVVLVAQEPEPTEAPVIVELFERIDAAHAMRSIALDFQARGITRRDGEPFSQQHLRNLALRHVYAGKRIFIPGRGTDHEGPAQIVDAIWPALVDVDLWERVQRVLKDPRRKTARPGRANHLLSMIAVCDTCGGPLSALLPGGKGKNLRTHASYRCQQKGCTKVDQASLDELVEGELLTYLGREDVYRSLESADDQDSDELRQVRADLGTVTDELDELQQALDAGEISAVMAGRSEAKKLERLAALEARERELTAPVGLGPIAPGEDVRARWAEAPMSARRETARSLLVPEILGRVRVTRSPYRGAPVSDRVIWETES